MALRFTRHRIDYNDSVTTFNISQDNGSDTTGDGSSGNPFATIQKAVDIIEAGSGGGYIIIDQSVIHQDVKVGENNPNTKISINAYHTAITADAHIDNLTMFENVYIQLNNMTVYQLIEDPSVTTRCIIVMEEGLISESLPTTHTNYFLYETKFNWNTFMDQLDQAITNGNEVVGIAVSNISGGRQGESYFFTNNNFLDMRGVQIKNGAAPTDNLDYTTMKYVDDEIAVLAGALILQSGWDANTNTPDLTLPGPKIVGHYYIVTTEGATDLDGITDWKVGDWAIYTVSGWIKADHTDQVSSVFARKGAVVAAASDYDASQVDNDSGVAGAFVSDALDTLAAMNIYNPKFWWVSPDSGSAIEDGTEQNPYKTIQAAIDMAATKGVIMLDQTVDNSENITVNKPLFIFGHSAPIGEIWNIGTLTLSGFGANAYLNNVAVKKFAESSATVCNVYMEQGRIYEQPLAPLPNVKLKLYGTTVETSFDDTDYSAVYGWSMTTNGEITWYNGFSMNDTRITDVLDPITPQGVATKNYVDIEVSSTQIIQDSDATEFTTMSSTFTQAKRFTKTTLAKTYLVKMGCEIYQSGKNKGVTLRAEIDDTIHVFQDWKHIGENEFINETAMAYGEIVVTLTAAAHNFDFDLRREKGGTAKAKNFRLIITEVIE